MVNSKPSPGRPPLALILIGGFLVMLGATVILGWLFRVPDLVRIVPGFAPMVFNTALCFVLLGGALVLAAGSSVRYERAQRWLAGLSIAIATLVLSQDLFSIDIGIDRLFSADWLQDARAHPTRMAPNTAIAFILGGSALLLLKLGRRPWIGYSVQYLALAVTLIGLAALLGYALKLEFLFAWYPYARMAVHTAAGFVLLGIGLWTGWRSVKNREHAEGPDTRIVFAGSVILAAMALAAGIGGFLVLVQQTEATLKRGLQVSLHNRVEVYRDSLNNAIVNVRDIATRPAIHRELLRLRAMPDQAEALEFLRQAVFSYTELGMSAVALDDAGGRRLTQAGTFARAPALRVPLNLPYRAELLWNQGMVLHARVPIIMNRKFLGLVVAEQPLPLLTRMFDNVRGLGETGEMVLCAVQRDENACFPTRLRPEAFTAPRRIQGKLLPISLALDGVQDVSMAIDYRGKQVIAAYSPIYQTGLGMVIKMNIEEVYQPVHRQFQEILLLLLALTVGGILLLRWQVLPLARRLMRSEQDARAAYDKLQESEQRWQFALEGSRDGVWDWNLKTNEVFFSHQWKKMLGYEDHEITANLEEWDKRVHPDDKARTYADIEKHLSGQAAHYENEHRVQCKDGSYKWILDRGMIVSRDPDGKAVRMIGTHTDITERKQHEDTVRELSLNDELTGLRNRRGFMALAEAEFLLARSMNRGLALFYADLDGMKDINDSYGHAQGDNALRDVSELLKKTFRDSDIIARLGGDEFAVLALETTQDRPGLIIQRLESNVAEHNRSAGRRYTLALSVGAVYVAPGSEMTMEALISQADAEMYRVKQARGAARRN